MKIKKGDKLEEITLPTHEVLNLIYPKHQEKKYY